MLTLPRHRLLLPRSPYLVDEQFNGSLPPGWTKADTYLTTQRLTNGGFETAGGGGADVFGTWAETAGDGAIADEGTLVHGGSHAAKLTGGVSGNTTLVETFTVIAGVSYSYSLWTRGDGSTAGRFQFWDASNSAQITAVASGTTGTAYIESTGTWVAPTGCTSVQVILRPGAQAGNIAYFDDVSVLPTYGLITVSNSMLRFAAGNPTPANGDPAIVWAAGITRRAGWTIEAKLRSAATNTAGPYLGLSNTTAANDPTTQLEHTALLYSDGTVDPYRLGTLRTGLPTYTAATWKYLRMVLLATGCLYYASDNGITWSLIWEDTAGVVATLYPVVYSYSAACDGSYVRWWQGTVKAPIVNDDFSAWSGWTDIAGTWQASGGVANSSSDANADLTVRTGVTADGSFRCTMSGLTAEAANYRFPNLVFRYGDSNTFLYTRVYNNTVNLLKNDTGATQLATAAQAIANGVAYTLEAICLGNVVKVYINGTEKISHTLTGGDTKYAAYTGIGLYLAKGGTPAATAATWDDLKVQS